jgi:hypothetical protein
MNQHENLTTTEEIAEMDTFCDERQQAALLAQEEDAFKMDTYEDKMRFLQSIHDEIDWKIAARENLLKI